MEDRNIIKEINDLTDEIQMHVKEYEYQLSVAGQKRVKRDALLIELSKARNVPVQH